MINIPFKYFLIWLPVLILIGLLAFIDLINYQDDFSSIAISITSIIALLIARFEILDIASEIAIYLKRNYAEQLRTNKVNMSKENFSPLFYSLFKLNNVDTGLKLLNVKVIKVFLFFFSVQIYLITLVILIQIKT
ncbi:MAG: hypothetical protein IPM56_01305 [Ignavibacteriales bacterium]|nr:MAG: hypothetical protein IPM56_01305 [Ignavibacteriales bacterium]